MPIKLKKGGIRYREDLKVFEVRLQVNKQRKYFYNKSKAECIKEANQFYNKLLKGITIESGNKYLLHDTFELWLNDYKQKEVVPATLKEYKGILNNHIKNDLSNKPVTKITILELDNYINKLPENRTKETIFMLLNEFFKFLYQKEIINKQVHDRFTKYKHIRAEGRFLTKEERAIFLEMVMSLFYKDFFLFIYYTGVRKHGALNLCYEDVDYEKEIIHIRETKTPGSDRYIPLNKNIKYLFTDKSKTGKVFNISDRQIKESINKLEELCGFRITPKMLRTTFATICREKGINEEVIAKWMGHTNTRTTKKYYIKIDPSFEKEQSKLL